MKYILTCELEVWIGDCISFEILVVVKSLPKQAVAHGQAENEFLLDQRLKQVVPRPEQHKYKHKYTHTHIHSLTVVTNQYETLPFRKPQVALPPFQSIYADYLRIALRLNGELLLGNGAV